MNRRKLLGFLGVAPAAAALPAVAETTIPATTPILGELKVFVTTSPFPFDSKWHYTVAKTMIWDGEKWVDEDSQAGVDVKNKVLWS